MKILVKYILALLSLVNGFNANTDQIDNVTTVNDGDRLKLRCKAPNGDKECTLNNNVHNVWAEVKETQSGRYCEYEVDNTDSSHHGSWDCRFTNTGSFLTANKLRIQLREDDKPTPNFLEITQDKFIGGYSRWFPLQGSAANGELELKFDLQEASDGTNLKVTVLSARMLPVKGEGEFVIELKYGNVIKRTSSKIDTAEWNYSVEFKITKQNYDEIQKIPDKKLIFEDEFRVNVTRPARVELYMPDSNNINIGVPVTVGCSLVQAGNPAPEISLHLIHQSGRVETLVHKRKDSFYVKYNMYLIQNYFKFNCSWEQKQGDEIYYKYSTSSLPLKQDFQPAISITDERYTITGDPLTIDYTTYKDEVAEWFVKNDNKPEIRIEDFTNITYNINCDPYESDRRKGVNHCEFGITRVGQNIKSISLMLKVNVTFGGVEYFCPVEVDKPPILTPILPDPDSQGPSMSALPLLVLIPIGIIAIALWKRKWICKKFAAWKKRILDDKKKEIVDEREMEKLNSAGQQISAGDSSNWSEIETDKLRPRNSTAHSSNETLVNSVVTAVTDVEPSNNSDSNETGQLNLPNGGTSTLTIPESCYAQRTRSSADSQLSLTLWNNQGPPTQGSDTVSSSSNRNDQIRDIEERAVARYQNEMMENLRVFYEYHRAHENNNAGPGPISVLVPNLSQTSTPRPT